MTLTLNRPEGQARKDAGQQLALSFDAEWRETVLDEFRTWLRLQRAKGFDTITIEAFRAQATSQPGSHKCWGSLPKMACKASLLAPLLDASGERVYRRAASPKTHCHVVAIWRVL